MHDILVEARTQAIYYNNMNYIYNTKVWVVLQSSVPVTTIVIEGGPYQYHRSTLNQTFVCSIYLSFVFCCVLM